MKHLLCISLLGFLASCSATEHCVSSKGVATPSGKLVETTCTTRDRGNIKVTRRSVSLDGRTLLVDEFLSNDQAIDPKNLHWIFLGKASPTTGCPEQLYLLDLTPATPKVFAFGVKAACNEFHWASWGKKSSTIAIRSNVKFIYMNGKLTAPPEDNELYSAIKPSFVDTPVEQLHPFAREIPLPVAK